MRTWPIVLLVATAGRFQLAGAQSPGDDAALRERIAAHERASAENDLRGLVDVYDLDAEMIATNGSITRG
jgi:hypothetical protein